MRVVAMIGMVGLLAASAGATDFYATNNLSANNYGTVGDELIIFTWETAAWVSVGDIGLGGFGGLDWDASGSTLIAADSFGATPGGIYSINPATAAPTLLGMAPTAMQDLALNRYNGKMYGTAGDSLYRDDNGDSIPETLVGGYGLGALEVGLGFDGAGNVYVHDLITDVIYKGVGDNPASVVALINLGYNSNYSQGLYVGDDRGYHGALDGGTLTSPNYSFNLDGTNYVMDSVFATHANGLPEVEVGDLTLVPEPVSAVLLALGGLLLAGRRR